MTTKIKDERVDARILSASLTGDEVQEALRDYVLRKAEVHDYEREYVDRAKSMATVTLLDGLENVREPRGASVTVYVDKSREPKCVEREPPPSARDLTRLISDWSASSNTTPLSEVVEKIRDLCR